MRRSERGASFIPLIIVIVLLLVAILWAWIKTDEADQLAKKVMGLEKNIASETEKASKAIQYLQLRLSPTVGWTVTADSKDADGKPIPSEYGSDYIAVKNAAIERLNALKDTYVRTFPARVYTVAEDGGKIASEEGENITVRYVEPGLLPDEANLEVVIGHMETAMGRMLNDLSRFINQIDTEKEAQKLREEEFNNTVQQKDRTISEAQDSYNTLQASARNREDELSAEVRTLEDRNRDLEEQIDQEQNARREEVARLTRELSAAKQEVVKAKKLKGMREKPIGPDGEVLAATEGRGLVVLNRGKDKHMQPGLKFTVYKLGKGAQQIDKAFVEVIEVYERTSKARVLELLNPMSPVVQGDLFASPDYNPAEVIHFYLLGRFKKYGRSDAARRLEMLGAKVDDKVGIETHFLVMGAPEREDEQLRDSDAYRRAQELGVKVITEDALARFMNY